MTIPNYGDKYDSPALFSATEAINEQGSDSDVDIPKAIIITYQRDFFEKILAERTGEPIQIVRNFEVHPIDEHVGDLLTEEEWDSGVEYENIQPKLLDPAIAALHDHLDVEE